MSPKRFMRIVFRRRRLIPEDAAWFLRTRRMVAYVLYLLFALLASWFLLSMARL